VRLKKRYLAAVAAAAVIGSMTVAAPALAAPGDPVVFPDANFRACVNAQLGQQANAVITQAQAASIRTLECDQMGIASLAGAESLTGLSTLRAPNNKIESLAPISGLTTLTAVDAVSNRIQDVTPLAGLSKLRLINIFDNAIADLSPVSKLTAVLYVDAAVQFPAVVAQCGAPYLNPVKNSDGTAATLTGPGYDRASNTINTTVPGTYEYDWTSSTANGSKFWGTLTVTVNDLCAPAPGITPGA